MIAILKLIVELDSPSGGLVLTILYIYTIPYKSARFGAYPAQKLGDWYDHVAMYCYPTPTAVYV